MIVFYPGHMKSPGILIVLLFLTTLLSGQKRLEKLHGEINSTLFHEISPVLDHKSNKLYFTRVGDPRFVKRMFLEQDSLSQYEQDTLLKLILSEISGIDIKNPDTSSYNQDIYYAPFKNGEFGKVVHPGYPLNNAFPNSICAILEEENALMVINQFDKNGGIRKGFSKVRQYGDDQYGFPEPIQVHDFYNPGNELSFGLSADAEHLFIAMYNAAKGDSDIYLSIRVRDNLWSEPVLLNEPLNSAFREYAPYLSRDKTRLYFASNRPGGMGGMDIYVAERLDYSYLNWSKPRALPQRLLQIRIF